MIMVMMMTTMTKAKTTTTTMTTPLPITGMIVILVVMLLMVLMMMVMRTTMSTPIESDGGHCTCPDFLKIVVLNERTTEHWRSRHKIMIVNGELFFLQVP